MFEKAQQTHRKYIIAKEASQGIRQAASNYNKCIKIHCDD